MAAGILRGDEGHKKGGDGKTHTSDNTISLPYSGVRNPLKAICLQTSKLYSTTQNRLTNLNPTF